MERRGRGKVGRGYAEGKKRDEPAARAPQNVPAERIETMREESEVGRSDERERVQVVSQGLDGASRGRRNRLTMLSVSSRDQSAKVLKPILHLYDSASHESANEERKE